MPKTTFHADDPGSPQLVPPPPDPIGVGNGAGPYFPEPSPNEPMPAPVLGEPQQQQRLYAGKYNSPEEMEAAYVEQQALLGRQGSELGNLRGMVEQIMMMQMQNSQAAQAPQAPPKEEPSEVEVLTPFVEQLKARGMSDEDAWDQVVMMQGLFERQMSRALTPLQQQINANLAPTVVNQRVAETFAANNFTLINPQQLAAQIQQYMPPANFLRMPDEQQRAVITMVGDALENQIRRGAMQGQQPQMQQPAPQYPGYPAQQMQGMQMSYPVQQQPAPGQMMGNFQGQQLPAPSPYPYQGQSAMIPAQQAPNMGVPSGQGRAQVNPQREAYTQWYMQNMGLPRANAERAADVAMRNMGGQQVGWPQ